MAAERLYNDLTDELEKTLTDEQLEISRRINDVYLSIVNGFLNDGIAYGFMLAKKMNDILNNPEKVFAQMLESEEDFQNRQYGDIKFLWDLQRESHEGGAVA